MRATRCRPQPPGWITPQGRPTNFVGPGGFPCHSDAKPTGTRCRFTLGVSKPLEPLALANHIEWFKKYTNQNVVSEKFSHDSGRTNQNGVSIMPGRWLPSGYRLIEVQYCTWKRWKFFHETAQQFHWSACPEFLFRWIWLADNKFPPHFFPFNFKNFHAGAFALRHFFWQE